MSENGAIEGAEWAGPEALPWHQIWMRAVTQPSLSTYQELLSLENATRNRAYKWMGVVGLVIYPLMLLAPDADLSASIINFGASSFGLSGNLSLLLCAPVAAFVPVLGLAFSAIIQHIAARILGGAGSYERLVFALGAFSAPLTPIGVTFSLGSQVAPIPFLNTVGLLLPLFQLALSAIAINAVYDVGWPKAAIAATVPWALVLLLIVLGLGLLVVSLAG